ncbi:MAG: 2OG-Fe dioxygenase family protein [Xanthomonadales bacterium]|nr:2OG-Fe dioxygenase family protein [Xanthomonadales bacterium]
MNPSTDMRALHDRLQGAGFAFVPNEAMDRLLQVRELPDWPAFAASWDDLAPDNYLAASGRHRRRRYATFSAGADTGVRAEPHQAHYQSLAYNPLQGDILRWFEPVAPEQAKSASLRRILDFCHDCFGTLAPDVTHWHVEVHQFRIEASAAEAGEPTPEGVHRDGVDYVLVLLIDRRNIERGTTTIHAADHRQLGSFTLAHPLDAALVDDHRVYHGVTAVIPADPDQPAHRDVLVVTFRRQGRPTEALESSGL